MVSLPWLDSIDQPSVATIDHTRAANDRSSITVKRSECWTIIVHPGTIETSAQAVRRSTISPGRQTIDHPSSGIIPPAGADRHLFSDLPPHHPARFVSSASSASSAAFRGEALANRRFFVSAGVSAYVTPTVLTVLTVDGALFLC
jgi:hypothetical protein